MSLVFETNNTRKYQSEIVDKTSTNFNHFVDPVFSRLLEVWYTCKFRNIRSQYVVVYIRDQGNEVFRVHATNIVNVDEFSTLCSLLRFLLGEKG